MSLKSLYHSTVGTFVDKTLHGIGNAASNVVDKTLHGIGDAASSPTGRAVGTVAGLAVGGPIAGLAGGAYMVSNNIKDRKADTAALLAQVAAGQKLTQTEQQTQLNAMAAKYGIDPKNLVNYTDFAGDPAKMTAAITRAELINNQDTYYPIEDALFNQTSYNNPNIASQGIAEAIGNGSITRNFITKGGRKPTGTYSAGGYVQGALDNAYNQQQRNFQRYGMNASTRQQSAIDNNDTMKRSTAVADAANKVRANIVDRDNQILMSN